MSTMNQHNMPKELLSPQNLNPQSRPPLITKEDTTHQSGPVPNVEIPTTQNTSSSSACWPSCHKNSEPYDINEARPSQESYADDSCWGGWMTTLGNLVSHYCGCSE